MSHAVKRVLNLRLNSCCEYLLIVNIPWYGLLHICDSVHALWHYVAVIP